MLDLQKTFLRLRTSYNIQRLLMVDRLSRNDPEGSHLSRKRALTWLPGWQGFGAQPLEWGCSQTCALWKWEAEDSIVGTKGYILTTWNFPWNAVPFRTDDITARLNTLFIGALVFVFVWACAHCGARASRWGREGLINTRKPPPVQSDRPSAGPPAACSSVAKVNTSAVWGH